VVVVVVVVHHFAIVSPGKTPSIAGCEFLSSVAHMPPFHRIL